MIYRIPICYIISSLLLAGLLCASAPIDRGQSNREQVSPGSSDLSKRAEDSFQQALALSGTKDRQLTRERLSQAIELWLQIRDSEKAARAALQIAEIYRRRKKFDEALHFYRQALEIKGIPVLVKATIYDSLGQVYSDAFANELALSSYKQSIDTTARVANGGEIRARTLINLAKLYYRLDNKVQAMACINQATLLIKRRGGSADADSLLLLAKIELERGDLTKARGEIDKALSLYESAGDVPGQIRVLAVGSEFYLLSGRYDDALGSAQRAVNKADYLASHSKGSEATLRAWLDCWPAWLALGRAQRSIGQKDAAIKSYKRAAAYLDGVWIGSYMVSDSLSIGIGQEGQALYRELAELLIDKGGNGEAYERFEQAKSRTLSGLIEARRTMQSKIAGQNVRLLQLSQTVNSLRTILIDPSLNGKKRTETEKELDTALQELEKERLEAELNGPKKSLIWSDPATVEQVQSELASDGPAEKECLIEFLLGEKKSFAWLISANNVSLEILPGRAEIEKQVEQYLSAISVQPDNLSIEQDIQSAKRQGAKLFSWLFPRMASQMTQGRKLIIVPDGMLYYLPFEALVHNERYLVEDHEISYVPSASLLRQLRTAKKNSDDRDRMELLAFGDPIFGYGAKTAAIKRSQRSVPRVVRGAQEFSEMRLAPLPNTLAEVNGIGALFPPDRVKIYVGKDATEDALKAEPLNRYRRIHFATHSMIDNISPSQSAVVLTLDNDPSEDGLVEVAEITELDLDADLVVLSACETGRGQLLSGEGVVGLSRAFLYAGARDVAVSLWKVDDISTGRLMIDFYRHIAAGDNNPAALRQAKIEMLRRGKETRHPFYWAPFVIVGKP